MSIVCPFDLTDPKFFYGKFLYASHDWSGVSLSTLRSSYKNKIFYCSPHRPLSAAHKSLTLGHSLSLPGTPTHPSTQTLGLFAFSPMFFHLCISFTRIWAGSFGLQQQKQQRQQQQQRLKQERRTTAPPPATTTSTTTTAAAAQEKSLINFKTTLISVTLTQPKLKRRKRADHQKRIIFPSPSSSLKYHI